MIKRVAIVGNCQVPGMTQFFSASAPDIEFKGFALTRFKTAELREEAAARLQDYDLVFCQNLSAEACGPLQASHIRAHHKNAVVYPQIVFSGFHPDVIQLAGSPLGGPSTKAGYHSTIVAAAFANNVACERVPKLFNAFNFARLGYFDEYPKSKRFFFEHADSLGYDLRQALARWQADGAFMHTPNHPTLRAIIGVAAMAAERASLPLAPVDTRALDDGLAHRTVLPVFAELARRIGISATADFKRSEIGGDGATLTLPEFVAQSYALYERAPADVLAHPRVRKASVILREDAV